MWKCLAKANFNRLCINFKHINTLFFFFMFERFVLLEYLEYTIITFHTQANQTFSDFR